MARREFYFDSASGRDKICAYEFTPEAEPWAVVQIVHGMAEHMGRYAPFAEYLNSRGYAVLGHDHLGHGKSAPKGRLGFMAAENGWRYLVDDTERMTELIEARYPGKPIILFAHSMGSKIGRIYLTERGDRLAKCVLSGMTEKVKWMGISSAIIRAKRKQKGPEARDEFLQQAAFGRHNRRIASPASPNAWLTRDEELVREYDQDPLSGFSFTIAGFQDLMELSKRIFARGFFEQAPKEVPVLVAVGGEDPCGGYGKGVEREVAKMRRAGMDVTLKIFPGARHELLNEINRQEVFVTLEEWMGKSLRPY